MRRKLILIMVGLMLFGNAGSSSQLTDIKIGVKYLF
jgi:hypothetical protein